MGLLSHQKPAVAACAKHFRSRQTVKWNGMDIHPPIVISAGVSSGKSVVAAELAKAVKEAALLRASPVTVYVMVIQRAGELCSQNSDAAWSIGLQNSVYSASCGGRKSTHYPAVYSTEGTLARALEQYRFTPYTPEEMQLTSEQRAKLGKWHPDLIIIDESHQVPFDQPDSQYIAILKHFYGCKPHMRLVGMTGSPFRGMESIVGDSDAHLWRSVASIEPSDPEYPVGAIGNGIISTEFNIEQGWVVPPLFGWPDDHDKEYDFSHLSPNGWEYDEAELDAATSDRDTCLAICQDVINKAASRKGVLVFAATQRHARMIAAAFKLLGVPDEQIGVITEKTGTKDRFRILEAAKTGAIKYTINVAVLTVGVNVPYWDTLVFMRPIGSLVLLIQAIGRVLRLLIQDGEVPMLDRDALTADERLALIAASAKPDSLVLDYANVMQTLGHMYENPVLEQADLEKAKKEHLDLIECPECATMNSPHARRCIGRDHFGNRCDHFWHFRMCPSCNTKNDQAARQCRNDECRRLLIDPNANLERKHYTDAESVQVRAMKVEAGRGGKLTIRYELADGRNPLEIYYPHAGQQRALNTRIWKGFVKQLPIADRDRFRLGNMKAETIMENLKLLPVPVELCARYNANGKWNLGRRKWADQDGGDVAA
jgi:superfamily II DNA or RNA helicase